MLISSSSRDVLEDRRETVKRRKTRRKIKYVLLSLLICRQALFYLSSPSFSLRSFSHLALFVLHRARAASEGRVVITRETHTRTQEPSSPPSLCYSNVLFIILSFVGSTLLALRCSKRVDCRLLSVGRIAALYTRTQKFILSSGERAPSR